MEEVPNPILINILSRLPFKTIHICKCVCKSWLDIFSDPYFADTHFKLSKTCILAHPFLLINVKPKRKNPFLLDWKVPNVLGCDAIVKFDPNAILLSDHCVMINSCDGLVCLWYPRLCREFCVCNPISGEYVTIPPPKTEWLGCPSFRCFGFSPRSIKYKIVKFSCRDDYRGLTVWKVDIFTIGMDNTWRNIGESLPLGGRLTRHTIVNSRVHWVVTECNNAELIRCFDFDCEGVQSVFPPKEFGAVHKSRREQIRLGVMGDCLYLGDYYSFDNYFDIWVMKDYGVQESWTKKFVISIPITISITGVINSSWMEFLDNGECLIFSGKTVWVSHNLMEKQFTEVKLGDITHRSISYKPSFIMLKEIARRQNWELVDIRHSKYIGNGIS